MIFVTNAESEFANLKKPHILYLITMTKNLDSFCKIGITRQTLQNRFKNYLAEGYVIEIKKVLYMDGYKARGIESMLLERGLDFLQKKQFAMGTRLQGYTETYQIEYLPTIFGVFNFLQNNLPKKTSEKFKKIFHQNNSTQLQINFPE